MNFPSSLIPGTLVKRYRRNLADVRLENGQLVTAHLFRTGDMPGCETPGNPVRLSDSGDRTRKNQLTWELVDLGGVWVGVNPKIAKHALLESIVRDEVESLRGYRIDDGTIAGIGGSNDILLQSMKDNCLINYQTVVSVREGMGYVPEDSGPSSLRDLERLASFAGNGHRAIAFYHVLRGDCTSVKVAKGTPQEQAIRKALNAGVEMMVFRAEVSPAGVGLGEPVRVAG